MPMNIRRVILILLLSAGLTADVAYSDQPLQFGTFTRDQFRDYWYNHGAEISRFSLQQMRYGEIHEGDAVFVFVTETMAPDIQVKADYPGPDDIPILKLNAVRKFFTGIYPYSILTSTFAPTDVQRYPLPLKVSSSTQEWCGHVYMQMNLRRDEYRVRMHSYFEKEGDRDFTIKKTIPEDAIWTMIRLAPAGLPRGEFLMIPGTVSARLLHRQPAPQKVTGRLSHVDEKSLEGNSLVLYEINFDEERRVLHIFFEKDFPYRIQKWSETYRGLFEKGTKTLTTTAVRTHTIQTAYWRQHGNRDRELLNKLGLATSELGGTN
jgi:hypothetical protein